LKPNVTMKPLFLLQSDSSYKNSFSYLITFLIYGVHHSILLLAFLMSIIIYKGIKLLDKP
jgi:hypothetical protein